ncbi:hypothetical protein VCRA2112O187_13910001 [Vibrio crassostreae]|nr:hypothetical protein VCRA2112O187_13910001 [Vibrio crassostreae]
MKDKQGNVVSEIQRTLYVRKKPQFRDDDEALEAEC